jgi:class 3 adenylate cyclase
LPIVHPETRYAKSGDVHIAYQVTGEGPRDLVFVSSWISQIEQLWELPSAARFLGRLASFSRLILFDKRGSGLSDRVQGSPSIDERMDDIRAVMDAVGSERAALFGTSEGGVLGCVFAATYPERTTALVLAGCMPRCAAAADYPWGWSPDGEKQVLDYVASSWGSGEGVALVAPSRANEPGFKEWFGRLERLTASPTAARDLWGWNMGIDIRNVLSAVRVPALVLHRSGDQLVPVESGRYLGAHIPGARYVELPGDDHYAFLGSADDLVDEVEEFLTGVRPLPETDRVLATVLFTDIVTSTERSARVGDRKWKDLLDEHDTLIRRELERHRGRLVKTTGDGILATFDGPARAIRCAQAIAMSVKSLGIEVRAGLHTGEIELRGEDVTGMGVNIAARVVNAAGPAEVVVSSTVKDLVAGSGLRFVDRGTHDLRGVPGEWHLYAVEG